MYALRSGQDSRRVGARSGHPHATSALGENLVLPKWLRRPARLLKRLHAGEFTVPRFAATGLTAVFMALTGAYGAYEGGHLPAYAQAVTARTGFAVDEVRVVGHKETSEIDILDRLELDGWTSLIGFDAEAARARVTDLPWVQEASVRKVYPDEIEVQVREREPFAIWQHGKELSVVEKDGKVIAPFTGGALSSLPQIIGVGATADAVNFVTKVEAYPILFARTKAYVRVAERRWDLHLNNGIVVKLPEYGEDAAIDRVVELDRQGNLLSRDLASIDMRIADRLVLQLTPEGLERRTAELEAQAKARKKAGKST